MIYISRYFLSSLTAFPSPPTSQASGDPHRAAAPLEPRLCFCQSLGVSMDLRKAAVRMKPRSLIFGVMSQGCPNPFKF